MRKPSTTSVRRRGKLQSEQLTIGLDLGDRSSFYCVLNMAGDVGGCFVASAEIFPVRSAAQGRPPDRNRYAGAPDRDLHPDQEELHADRVRGSNALRQIQSYPSRTAAFRAGIARSHRPGCSSGSSQVPAPFVRRKERHIEPANEKPSKLPARTAGPALQAERCVVPDDRVLRWREGTGLDFAGVGVRVIAR